MGGGEGRRRLSRLKGRQATGDMGTGGAAKEEKGVAGPEGGGSSSTEEAEEEEAGMQASGRCGGGPIGCSTAMKMGWCSASTAIIIMASSASSSSWLRQTGGMREGGGVSVGQSTPRSRVNREAAGGQKHKNQPNNPGKSTRET